MTKKTAIKKPTPRKQATRETPAATAAKKTPTKVARQPARKTAVRAPADTATVYQFDATKSVVPRVIATKAGRGPSPSEFASFEDVKDRAIDFLIDFIADCEQQLWDLKRSENYESYTALLAAAERQRS
jgi:hypothetical protein